MGFGLGVIVHAAHNAFTTLFSYSEGVLAFCFAVGIDWSGVLVLLIVLFTALYLEKRRVTTYLRGAVAVGLLAQRHVPTISSPWRRTWTRLAVLLRGDFKRWRTLGRYYHLVTEAAFSSRRWQRGDAISKTHLAHLEQKLLAMRGILD
jgi:hypothetical protein